MIVFCPRYAVLAMATGLIALTAFSFSASAQPNTDNVRLGMQLEPPHLDPTSNAAEAIDSVTYGNIFEGLTHIDGNGAVTPSLATDWEISQDGLVYIFNLKPGVRFHDGTDFEATDVVFSLDRARAEESVNAQKALFEQIKSVKAIEPLKVKVTLKRPTGQFLFNLGLGDASMVAPESAANNATNPIGTGPYTIGTWVRGARLELEANKDYHGAAPAIQKAFIIFITDANAALNAILAGDLDAFPGFPAPEALELVQKDPRFDVVVGTTEGETILSTNNARAPFDDVRVRQAMAHAINRDELIEGAQFGFGTPIGTHFAPHHPFYLDLTTQYEFNLDKARALLAQAGHADGIEATLKLPPTTYARRSGELIASQLRRVGIQLDLINVEWAQWLDEVFQKTDFDLSIVAHTEPFDIGIYARETYYFNYDNARFKELNTQLVAAIDPEIQKKLAQQMQQILADDAVNGFLFQLAKTGVWHKDLKGYRSNAPIAAQPIGELGWQQ